MAEQRSRASFVLGPRDDNARISKYELPEKSIAPDAAYNYLHDQLSREGNPARNMSTFLTTWMEPTLQKLVEENMFKNIADQDEYPRTVELHNRCVRMLAHLFHAPGKANPIGTACVGSSEAFMLCALAMKYNWQKHSRERSTEDDKGKDEEEAQDRAYDRPNIVMGTNAKIVLEKIAQYLGLEVRQVPVGRDSRYVMDVEKAVDMCDENTVGVAAVLGSPYTGHFEEIGELCRQLDGFQEEMGIDVPVHVDAAAGGFVAPFVSPKLEWDFRLERVKSINVSGHKYGLVLPGVGWAIWRDESYVPQELITHTSYLGHHQSATVNLNLARNAAPIVAQYYNFIRLGADGYRRIISRCLSVAKFLSLSLEHSGYFELHSSAHVDDIPCIPVVAFSLKGQFKRAAARPVAEDFQEQTEADKQKQEKGEEAEQEEQEEEEAKVGEESSSEEDLSKAPTSADIKFIDEWELSAKLKHRGWNVPAFRLPAPNDDVIALRAVIRENHNEEIVEEFMRDLVAVVHEGMSESERLSHRQRRETQAKAKREREEKSKKENYESLMQYLKMGEDKGPLSLSDEELSRKDKKKEKETEKEKEKEKKKDEEKEKEKKRKKQDKKMKKQLEKKAKQEKKHKKEKEKDKKKDKEKEKNKKAKEKEEKKEEEGKAKAMPEKLSSKDISQQLPPELVDALVHKVADQIQQQQQEQRGEDRQPQLPDASHGEDAAIAADRQRRRRRGGRGRKRGQKRALPQQQEPIPREDEEKLMQQAEEGQQRQREAEGRRGAAHEEGAEQRASPPADERRERSRSDGVAF